MRQIMFPRIRKIFSYECGLRVECGECSVVKVCGQHIVCLSVIRLKEGGRRGWQERVGWLQGGEHARQCPDVPVVGGCVVVDYGGGGDARQYWAALLRPAPRLGPQSPASRRQAAKLCGRDTI